VNKADTKERPQSKQDVRMPGNVCHLIHRSAKGKQDATTSLELASAIPVLYWKESPQTQQSFIKW
jgi:hypothetical protein